MDEEAIIEQLVRQAMASGDVSMMQRLAERARDIASTGNAYGTSGVEPPQPTGELRGTGPGESRDPYARDPQMQIARGVADVAAPFVNQGINAASAVGKAVNDPTLGNVTNAGTQTALAVMQPAKALGILGAGYTAAAADDMGVIDGIVGDAMATPKKKERQFPNGYTEGQLQGLADKTGMTVEQLGNMRKGKLDTLVQQLAISQGTAGTQAEAEQKRLEREEYDRQVKTAEAARDKELSRDRRFADSKVGKMYEETGGVLPFAAAYGAGALSRLGTGGGTFLKDYALPIMAGTGASFATMNAPLFADMNAPTANPEKAAFLAYARELPPDHPRKQEMLEYAQKLPDRNPVQEQAYAQFYEGLPKRLGVSAIEGLTFGKLGAASVNAGPRIVKDVFSGKPSGPPAGPGPQTPSTQGQTAGVQPTAPNQSGATSPTPTTPTPPPAGPSSRATGKQTGTQAGASRLSKSDEQDIFTAYRANENMTPADVIAANPALTGKERQILDYMQRVESSIKATGKKDRAKAFDAVDAIRRARLAVPLAVGGYGLSQPVDPEAIARAVILRQQQEGQ